MWLPFFVSLVLGEIFAGEVPEARFGHAHKTRDRGSGVCVQVHRLRDLHTALVSFLGFAAYVLGAIFFGTGGLLTYGSRLIWFSSGEGLARLALAYWA